MKKYNGEHLVFPVSNQSVSIIVFTPSSAGFCSHPTFHDVFAGFRNGFGGSSREGAGLGQPLAAPLIDKAMGKREGKGERRKSNRTGQRQIGRKNVPEERSKHHSQGGRAERSHTVPHRLLSSQDLNLL